MKDTIKIGCINEEDLKNIVANKKIVIFGMVGNSRELFKLLKRKNLEVFGFCVKNDKMSLVNVLQLIWIKLKYKEVNIFKENEMTEILKNNEDLCLIENPRNETENKHEVKEESIYTLPGGKMIVSFLDQWYIHQLKNNVFFRVKEVALWNFQCRKTDEKAYSQFRKKNYDNPIYICLPSKTADHTLLHTFRDLNIPACNWGHRPRFLKQIKHNKPVKIITGLREPISQNISFFYQVLGTGFIYKNLVMGELSRTKKHEKKAILKKYAQKFAECKDDVQSFFELMVQQHYPKEGFVNRYSCNVFIQEFFDHFTKNIVDITQYPFDQAKGYTIIKSGKLEIFVYQLEKLNDLVPELSEWVGVPFDKLENVNVGGNKWIGESYKQAFREIEITQEYFDRCYAEPYVQHCYSQEDIERFKARWHPHIKKN